MQREYKLTRWVLIKQKLFDLLVFVFPKNKTEPNNLSYSFEGLTL